jgi:hypothetical protein
MQIWSRSNVEVEHADNVLRTTLPRITRSAPFPPVSSRGARRCREPVSLPISTTEETHKTLDIGLGLWPLSDLCNMKGCTCSLYRDVRPLRGKAVICPHNPNYGYLTILSLSLFPFTFCFLTFLIHHATFSVWLVGRIVPSYVTAYIDFI